MDEPSVMRSLCALPSLLPAIQRLEYHKGGLHPTALVPCLLAGRSPSTFGGDFGWSESFDGREPLFVQMNYCLRKPDCSPVTCMRDLMVKLVVPDMLANLPFSPLTALTHSSDKQLGECLNYRMDMFDVVVLPAFFYKMGWFATAMSSIPARPSSARPSSARPSALAVGDVVTLRDGVLDELVGFSSCAFGDLSTVFPVSF
jgi:hypothetical protein